MNSNRISSIDIMRGLTLFLMLFVNDLNMSVAPSWLGHMEADFDGMGLADWVFPGFLFIVGMSVPFAFSKRISSGADTRDMTRHIIIRWISLIIIGVLMLNTGRVNAELTGIGRNLWALLMYVGVFLVWNDYHDKENRFFTVTTLKLLGIAILVFLVMKFNSGKPENNGSLITSWWGILGLIGWGYLAGAFTFLVCRNSLLFTSLVTALFLCLNILSGLDILKVGGIPGMVFGTILQGNVPFIVLSGLIAGLIIKKRDDLSNFKVISIFAALGILYLAAGFLLRKWFIISKIEATPSWGLICNGISMLVFILIYWIADIKGIRSWAGFLKPAGEHSLTTYLAPDILYYLIWMSGVPVLFYKHSTEPLLVVAGSLVWAVLMVFLTGLLVRMRIRLKL